MNILVDIGHPAQAHLFKHFIRLMQARGHEVTVYAREKENTLRLLEAEGIKPWGFTRARGTLAWNMIELLVRDLEIWRLVRRRRIQVAIGTSISIAHTTLTSGVPSFIFNEDDLDVVPLMGKLAYPFCTGIVAPRCVRMGRWAHKHIAYDGYQKLAYLHPKRFTPDPAVPERFGINSQAPYFLLRLTAFNAYHDDRHRGLTHAQVHELVERLSPHGRVLINSEKALPPEWMPYRLAVPPEHIHHVMAFARLFIGDGQSMITESALLGTPAIRCNTFVGQCSVLDEIEQKYQLAFGYLPGQFPELLQTVDSLLANPDMKAEWLRRREALLRDKIDVTAWMMDFIESQLPDGTPR